MQMMEPAKQIGSTRGAVLLCILLLICYSNTFDAGWHLDDHPNIINNSRLHMQALTVDAVERAFTALPSDPGDTIWRPLPCLSLAINWLWGQDDPFGYHAVNLILHMITACMLFVSIRLLLQAPVIKVDLSSRDRFFIALLSAGLWAVNPIQIQAVTYIIQRMAIMAAMFSILGMVAYLRGRLAPGATRWGWFCGAVVFFSCALLSKENAVLLPFSILLIEFVFFRQMSVGIAGKWINKRNMLIGGVVLLGLVGFIALTTSGNPIDFGYYAKRPFTMWERLISQPRILLFYLSLMIYPAPWRFSIEHDINHSLSLVDPWTTLPAMAAAAGLVLAAFLSVRKYPLLSFGILFFFLNHLVESTILPLELVFEHRNYLPSFFLFLPVSFGVHQMLTRYRQRRRSIYFLLVVSVAVVLSAMGLACYDRNKAWKTDYSLWYSAFKNSPGRARTLMALGVAIGWGDEAIPNRHDIAMNLFQRALALPNARKNERAQIQGNIGLIHAAKGELPRAIAAYEQALDISPDERKIRFDLLQGLIAMGRWHEAHEQVEILLADDAANSSDLSYKGFINLWMGMPDRALSIFQDVLATGYHDAFVYHNIAVAMTRLDAHDRGKWFLDRALETVEGGSRGKMIIYFALMENRRLADDELGVKDAAYRMLAEFGLDEVLNTLQQLPLTRTHPPLDTEMVAQILSSNLIDIAGMIDVP